jgi:hypothetical protein
MISQSEYVRLKRRLSTAENRVKRAAEGDPRLAGNYCLPVREEDDPRIPHYRALLAEVRSAWAIFEREGFPDNWPRWRNAGDDAEQMLRWVEDVEAVDYGWAS